ncbi:MAG TPA: glycosyltransferase family 9 protein, partial [Smithellaceae bacterium]|nr:glycosyltransferase family 9 protein [Smithellaceae bacterium]
TRPRIGLAWSGSAAHTNDRHRSIPLETLLPLLGIHAEFHSLQKEYREADRRILMTEENLIDHSDRIGDFGDTAALMEEMDLVISVDTAAAHLAGALGKPVWVLLPCIPDFRWLQHREDSPWYPTARLFRQTTPGDWNPVLERIQNLLGLSGSNLQEIL